MASLIQALIAGKHTSIDDVNLSKDTSLTHLLNNEGINDDDEDISIIKYSSYHTIVDLENIKLAKGSINIMSLNCQRINAKFNELQIIIEEINNNPLSLICPQESWMKENIGFLLYNLANYKLINQFRTECSYHESLMIYIHDRCVSPNKDFRVSQRLGIRLC